MDNLNPIQQKRQEFSENLQKGFSEGNPEFTPQDSPILQHRRMVAGRVTENIEKGLAVGAETTTHQVLTPANAGTIQEVVELIKSGNWEFFSRSDIDNFSQNLQKSLDSQEIDYQNFTDGLKEIGGLNKTIIKGLDGEAVAVWYRPRKVSLEQLSKAVDYKKKLDAKKQEQDIEKSMACEHTYEKGICSKCKAQEIKKGDDEEDGAVE